MRQYSGRCSTSPVEAQGALQWVRGLLRGLGFPSALAVVAKTPVDLRGTVLGLVIPTAYLHVRLGGP